MQLMQIQPSDTARNFSPWVSFRTVIVVTQPPCAIACDDISVYFWNLKYWQPAHLFGLLIMHYVNSWRQHVVAQVAGELSHTQIVSNNNNKWVYCHYRKRKHSVFYASCTWWRRLHWNMSFILFLFLLLVSTFLWYFPFSDSHQLWFARFCQQKQMHYTASWLARQIDRQAHKK